MTFLSQTPPAELSGDEIALAASELLDESISADAKAGFLTHLAQRGETASEIAGFVKAFLKHAVDPKFSNDSASKPLLDVCGTGGDKLDLFNVSTTAVFVLAAAGSAVVKHGNRGITSKSGGADVLESLGIDIAMSPTEFSECVREIGAGFLFAQKYHPAFKAIAPVRTKLAESGQRTLFNLVGPLLNPCRPEHQVIGVFDESLGAHFAQILAALGRKRALVVHGKTPDGRGMDELSSCGPNLIWQVVEGKASPEPETFDPLSLDIAPHNIDQLTGGEASENAAITMSILQGGEKGPKQDIVALNVGAGLVAAGLAGTIEEGFSRALDILASGAGYKVLESWKAFSVRK